MTIIRLHAADADPVAVLHAALGLNVSPTADTRWTVASHVLRRVAAIHAPCSRRNLLLHAGRALEAVFEDRTETLHDILDDLIAGGDLTEQPGLRAGSDEAPELIFPVQPGFSTTRERIYLHGVAADDAPCIPKSVSEAMVCAGALRFLDCNERVETIGLLRKLGLREHDAAQRLDNVNCPTPRELVDHYLTCLDSEGRTEALADVYWLTPRSDMPYRRRWSTQACDKGLQIARAPQHYGAHAWLLMDHDAPKRRFVQLPIRGATDERGCDAAWRLQLALDALTGVPARYRVEPREGQVQIQVDFPLPVTERRKLLHLGGERLEAGRPYDFVLPRDALPTAQSVLSQLYFEPLTPDSES